MTQQLSIRGRGAGDNEGKEQTMMEWLKRADPEPDPDGQPIERYRTSGRQLRSTGGAYVVLPYGLLANLHRDDQATLVGLLMKVAHNNPAWTRDLTYEVRAWERVRIHDLSDEERTWHGITTDVNAAGDLTYTRGGQELDALAVVGNRPVIDPTPTLPGTHPGARPQLLASTPQNTAAPGQPGGDRRFRHGRAERLMLTRCRREAIAAYIGHADQLDGGWIWSIASTDELWGTDEQWKRLVDTNPISDEEGAGAPDVPGRPVSDAAPEAGTAATGEAPTDSGDEAATADPAAASGQSGSDELDADAAFLTRLEEDLHNLY